MSDLAPSAADDEARLVAVLDDYLAAVQSGAPPDATELLARHPDLADDLKVCLASLTFLRRASARPAPVAPPPQDEGPAATLGDFRLLHEVGRGGMGVVYEAVQVSLGRRVALKVLPLAAALDGRQLQRFKTEAQAAAQLHHPNIVPVHAVGCDRGVHYYAMQFIDGVTLADFIHRLRLPTASTEVRPAAPTGSATSPAPGTPAGPRTFFGVGREEWSAERGARSAGKLRASLFTPQTPPSTPPPPPPPRRSSAPSPGWGYRRPRPWSTPTSWGWSTATSSRPTCWWIPPATCG